MITKTDDFGVDGLIGLIWANFADISEGEIGALGFDNQATDADHMADALDGALGGEALLKTLEKLTGGGVEGGGGGHFKKFTAV